jgi:ATP-binding cassette subfamily B (MDR/TAP) protein 1
MPLMNIVFGNIVGGFNGYFTPGNGPSEDEFRTSIDYNAYASLFDMVLPIWTNGYCSLRIVYLFIGKLVLTYVAMVNAITSHFIKNKLNGVSVLFPDD